VRKCAGNGLSSTEVTTCASNEYCDAASATCKTGICAPGEPACDGTRATTCNASGSDYEAGGKTCSATETCTSGVCQPHVCEPNATFCQGQDVKSCSSSGLSSSVSATCIDQACVKSGSTAACSGVCAPGQMLRQRHPHVRRQWDLGYQSYGVPRDDSGVLRRRMRRATELHGSSELLRRERQ
jgi:hypothetical protein